jgi:hypothetical protein
MTINLITNSPITLELLFKTTISQSVEEGEEEMEYNLNRNKNRLSSNRDGEISWNAFAE